MMTTMRRAAVGALIAPLVAQGQQGSVPEAFGDITTGGSGSFGDITTGGSGGDLLNELPDTGDSKEGDLENATKDGFGDIPPPFPGCSYSDFCFGKDPSQADNWNVEIAKNCEDPTTKEIMFAMLLLSNGELTEADKKSCEGQRGIISEGYTCEEMISDLENQEKDDDRNQISSEEKCETIQFFASTCCTFDGSGAVPEPETESEFGNESLRSGAGWGTEPEPETESELGDESLGSGAGSGTTPEPETESELGDESLGSGAGSGTEPEPEPESELGYESLGSGAGGSEGTTSSEGTTTSCVLLPKDRIAFLKSKNLVPQGCAASRRLTGSKVPCPGARKAADAHFSV